MYKSNDAYTLFLMEQPIPLSNTRSMKTCPMGSLVLDLSFLPLASSYIVTSVASVPDLHSPTLLLCLSFQASLPMHIK